MTTPASTTPPVQATAAATTPVAVPAAPASAPAAVASPTTPAVETTQAQGVPVAAVAAPTVAPMAGVPSADPRAAINELAEAHGYEAFQFSQYPDVESATAAISQAALQAAAYARQGNANPLGYSPQNPYQSAGALPVVSPVAAPGQPAAPVVVAPLDLKALGLEEDEPAAKAIRAMEKSWATSTTTTAELTARLDAIETANAATVKANALATANSFIDGLKSPVYGMSKTRTQAQQHALNRLIDTADDIAIGHFNATGQVLPIPVRLARAVAAERSLTAAPPLPAPATAPAAALPQSAAPTGPGAPTPYNPNAKWSANPAIRAAAGLR